MGISSFQYNSCYCLSLQTQLDEANKQIFQYNSCYCLSSADHFHTTPQFISIQLLLLFISSGNTKVQNWHYFNTTLVTVYLCPEGNRMSESQFQYNSCYCLSNVFMPFLVFIIVSFPDEINVSLIFSQPIV